MPVHIRIDNPSMLRPNIRQQNHREVRLALKLKRAIFHISREIPKCFPFFVTVCFALIDAVAHCADDGVQFTEQDAVFVTVEGVPGLHGQEGVGVFLLVLVVVAVGFHRLEDIAYMPKVKLRIAAIRTWTELEGAWWASSISAPLPHTF